MNLKLKSGGENAVYKIRIIEIIKNYTHVKIRKKNVMNLKAVMVLLIFMRFINSNGIDNIESKAIKYSEVVTKLIEAETLNDAKMILKIHDSLDQRILREYLLEEQSLWFLKHGLYDCIASRYVKNEGGKYVGACIVAISLGVSAGTLYLCNFNCSKAFSVCATSTTIGIICGLRALEGSSENTVLKQYLDEFKRIKELLIFVG